MNWSELMTSARFFASETVLESIGWCLFHSLWQIMLIAAIAWIILKWINPRHATARYFCALVGLFLACVSPLATWFLLEPNDAVSLVEFNRDRFADTNPMLEAGSFASALVDSNPPATWIEFAQARVQPWLSTATAAWLLGMCLFSIRPLLGLTAILQMKRRGTSRVTMTLERRLDELISTIALSRPTRIASSTLTNIPMVIGFFRPMILLPASTLTHLSATELDAVLAHELAHLKRYDDVVNLLQTIVESIFFFHPAVWWLSEQIRVERESCCDDIAVSVVGGAKPLATALLQLEQMRVLKPGLSATGGSLVARVRRLKSMQQPTRNIRMLPWCLVATALLMTALLLGFVLDSPVVAVTQSETEQTSRGDSQTASRRQENDIPPAEPERSNPTITETVGPVKIATDPETGLISIQGELQDVEAIKSIIRRIATSNTSQSSPTLSNIPQEKTDVAEHGLRVPSISQRVLDQPDTKIGDLLGQDPVVIYIRNRKADKIAETVTLMFAETAGMGDLKIKSDAWANSIRLQATQENGLKYVLRLIEVLDVPRNRNPETSEENENTNQPAKTTHHPRVYRISNRDAEEVAQSIRSSCEQAIDSGKLIIAVEKLSNSIVVSTDASTLLGVEALIRSSDAPQQPTNLHPNESGDLVLELSIDPKHRHRINGEFKRAQSNIFKQRSAIGVLRSRGHVADAIEESKRLKRSIAKNEQLTPEGKDVLLEIVDRDIAQLSEKPNPALDSAHSNHESVVGVSLQVSSSVQFTGDAELAVLRLSNSEVVKVSPVSKTGFRVAAVKPGSVSLEAIDSQGAILQRYHFVVQPTDTND